jgi:hypothetical protein
MPNKQIASLLICTVTLLGVVPSRAVAQTSGQSKLAISEQSLNDEQARPTPDLKAVFAEKMADIKAGSLAEANLKRIKKGEMYPQSGTKSNSGLSKKEKIFLVVFLVALTGLAIVAAVNRDENSPPICADEPRDINCTP